MPFSIRFAPCRILLAAVSLGLLLLFNGLAISQTTPAKAPASYQLGPDDVLQVTVERYLQYSHESVRVLPDGTINLPFYGTLKVSGKTVTWLQSQLRARLAGRMKNPQLTVAVTQPRPVPTPVPPPLNYINTIGALRSPGRVQIKKGDRITEVVALVGGVAGRLDEVEAALARKGQPVVQVDLRKAITDPRSAANFEVKDGDVLTVTTVDLGRIAVYGAVARPGVYALRRSPNFGTYEVPVDPKLVDVILAAGGLKSSLSGNGSAVVSTTGTAVGDAVTGEVETAGDATIPASAQVIDPELATPAVVPQFTGFVLRDTNNLPLDIEAALTFKDLNANISLRPGDFLNIVEVPPPPPVPPLNIYVDGLVRSPGKIQLAPQNGTIVQAVVKAGGITRSPENIRASLQRAGREYPLDLSKVLLTDDPAVNMPLQDGDVLQLQEPLSIQVVMSGSVARPDALKLPTNATLLDALVQSGGLTIEPDTARLTILRGQPEGTWINMPVDPVKLTRLEADQNVALKDGDFISVTQIQPDVRTVSISGQVTNQGSYEVVDKADLAQLVLKAGGPTGSAALTRVLVIRDGQTQTVDVYDTLKTGVAQQAFALQDGDHVVVPEINEKVLVMEAVQKPGAYAIPEKGSLTIFQALTLAGGALPNTKEVVLVRPEADGTARPRIIPLAQIREGDLSGVSEKLQAGDILYVPQGKTSKSLLQKVLPALGIFRFFGL